MALPRRFKLSVADLQNPTGFSKLEYVEHLYRVMLQREPDPNGLEAYLRRGDTHNFFHEFISCREFKEISRTTAYFSGNANDKKRILLFGAYGNGNLGDAIQAMSLLRAIKSIREDLEVWACSQLPSQFPFPFEYVLSAKKIYKASLVNQFDLVIIGGGGLLSHPHDPLTDEAWQRSLDVPVALFGIGAGSEVASKGATLIKKAVYVSGRDEPSLTALRRFRDDVRFVPDPVLADPHYSRGADKGSDFAACANKLWILKHTSPARAIQFAQLVDPNEDRICFVEPFLDFPLLEVLPTARPVHFVDDLITLIDRSAMVISMRYHGCILALLRDKPAVGLFERKSLDLLTRYDLGHCFCSDDREIPGSANFTSPKGKLLGDRNIFRDELVELLSLIPIAS
jgi:hypothetical protein